MAKNFLIIEETKEIQETREYPELENRIHDFLNEEFDYDEEIPNSVTIEVDFRTEFMEREARDYLFIQLSFNEFKSPNKARGAESESIWLVLDHKGKKPFYDNGNFFSRDVYEYTEGMGISEDKEIYGISGDKLYQDFIEFILTC